VTESDEVFAKDEYMLRPDFKLFCSRVLVGCSAK